MKHLCVIFTWPRHSCSFLPIFRKWKKRKKKENEKKVPTPWNPYTFLGSTDFFLLSDPVGILRDFPIRFWKKKGTDPLESLYNFWVDFKKWKKKFISDPVGILRDFVIQFSKRKRYRPLEIPIQFCGWPRKTKKNEKRITFFLKKGTDPLESLYNFGVHRFFFSFRSCWNPSGFSDSILGKKKVPTPWNPYTILGCVNFFLLSDPVGILRDFPIRFWKKKGTDPLKSLYNFGTGLKKWSPSLFPILLESFGIFRFDFGKKKGTDPLKSLYNFGARGSFFSFRSRWNPSGFCDSILEKKKVPTPWNPYTILGPVDLFLVCDPVGILRDFVIQFSKRKRYRPLGIPIHFVDRF